MIEVGCERIGLELDVACGIRWLPDVLLAALCVLLDVLLGDAHASSLPGVLVGDTMSRSAVLGDVAVIVIEGNDWGLGLVACLSHVDFAVLLLFAGLLAQSRLLTGGRLVAWLLVGLRVARVVLAPAPVMLPAMHTAWVLDFVSGSG